MKKYCLVFYFMDGIDPVTKQYLIFSTIISMIISFFFNFFLVNFLENSFILYGFPLGLKGTTGLINLFYRLINTLVVGLLLIVPMYLFLNWIKSKLP
ncbi:MAG: hypothetical protein NZZ41_03720 [Candidatus Dojkabacteria bacterium]|nr:hypothetical protein [Candidatus Dojkabacteria bacterium]